MQPFVHDVPAIRVVFGPGRRTEALAELDRAGWQRPLLIGSATSRAAAQSAELLGRRLVGRFDQVATHVPAPTAARATDLAAQFDADVLVAVGGGSAIGTAKAVARATQLPILAVPTTYSGSEMTNIWGETRDRTKVTGRDPHVLPRVVIYDPELTLSLAPAAAAASGINALAHLVEGMYAPGVSPLSMSTAREGATALSGAIPAMVADPTDLGARSQLTYGAWLGGWVLGTTAMGLHHKLCHILGGRFDLPHAACHTAILPYAVAANAAYAPEAMRVLEEALRAGGRTVDHTAGAVWDLRVEGGANHTLATLGLQTADLDSVAAAVAAEASVNPRPVDYDCVLMVLRAALDGARPPSNL